MSRDCSSVSASPSRGHAKAVLVHGGAVADHIADGEAELGIHQISEILPVKGTVLVGPLPAEIQNFTVYAAGVASAAQVPEGAHDLARFLAGAHARRSCGPRAWSRRAEPRPRVISRVPKKRSARRGRALS